LSHVERRQGLGTITPAIFFGTFCLAIENSPDEARPLSSLFGETVSLKRMI
jgi:hypothetical protein